MVFIKVYFLLLFKDTISFSSVVLINFLMFLFSKNGIVQCHGE